MVRRMLSAYMPLKLPFQKMCLVYLQGFTEAVTNEELSGDLRSLNADMASKAIGFDRTLTSAEDQPEGEGAKDVGDSRADDIAQREGGTVGCEAGDDHGELEGRGWCLCGMKRWGIAGMDGVGACLFPLSACGKKTDERLGCPRPASNDGRVVDELVGVGLE